MERLTGHESAVMQKRSSGNLAQQHEEAGINLNGFYLVA